MPLGDGRRVVWSDSWTVAKYKTLGKLTSWSGAESVDYTGFVQPDNEAMPDRFHAVRNREAAGDRNDYWLGSGIELTESSWPLMETGKLVTNGFSRRRSRTANRTIIVNWTERLQSEDAKCVRRMFIGKWRRTLLPIISLVTTQN